jgi:hypothetical protein
VGVVVGVGRVLNAGAAGLGVTTTLPSPTSHRRLKIASLPGEEKGRALRLMAVRQTRLWGGVAREFGLPRRAPAKKILEIAMKKRSGSPV